MVQFLSPESLRSRVPSAFAGHEADGLSRRYAFVSTEAILTSLAAHGFQPTKAVESRTRTEGHAGFQRHMIRFAHCSSLSHSVGDERFEVVLINSHNGSSSLRVMGGVYRLVCSNGMVIGSDMFKVSAKHIGSADDVVDAAFTVVDAAPAAMAQVGAMKALTLNGREQLAFAETAREVMENANVPTATALLAPRRREDAGDDLWRVFNRVQENAIRGGVAVVDGNGRRRRTRAVRSVEGDVKLNSALWSLAERMRELKG